jgi:hypothetical protein
MSIMKFLRILLNESGMEGMYQFAPGERHVELVAAQSQVASLIAAYDALAPDWSQAPDGAQWYTIDADGVATFFDVEPEWEMFEWVIDWRSDPDAPSYPNEPWILDAGFTDVPLGIDWRLCKWQRPEATA